MNDQKNPGLTSIPQDKRNTPKKDFRTYHKGFQVFKTESKVSKTQNFSVPFVSPTGTTVTLL